ncbi:MAG: ECF transporter S component [Firmicutes bacterium]|nr:ECF transporter S component [Bacillota bacterium]
MNKNVLKLVLSAVTIALIFVATIFIQIPLVNGYANAGDSVVVITGIILGPFWGAMAAGIGSALADLVLGYSIYIPATLVIKAFMGFLVGWVYKKANTQDNKKRLIIMITVTIIIAELIMTAGYLLFESIIYSSFATAMLALGGNALQGLVNAVISVTVFNVFEKQFKMIRI